MNNRSKLPVLSRISPAKRNAVHKPLLASAVAVALAMGAFVNVAHAADDSLTWNGITLYGVIDGGFAHQTHGATLSPDFYPGLEYMISKNSNKSIDSFAPNGLSQSKLGLKGTEPVGGEFSVVFNAEMGFEPQSGHLADALKALSNQDGVALANQKSGADGSRAGQFLNGQEYFGVDSKNYGTLTFGRQNSLLLDNINNYDPMGGSYAFSIIGYSGTTAGMGDTEDTRLDDSLKYFYKTDMFHVGGLYEFGHVEGSPAQAWQGDLGFNTNGFSVDGIYAHKKDAIGAGALSAAQLLTHPADSLTATISDNTSYTLDASYVLQQAKFFGGYEHIRFENPGNPVAGPFYGLGGYLFSVVSNTTYNNAKILQVSWLGARYSFTSDFDLTGAWYHLDQNSYKGNGCSNNSAGSCSGSENVYSIMGDYRFTKHFDGYAGVAFSHVANGLSSGFLNTSTADPMIGFRFKF
jgi:predicted porin